MKVGMTGHQDLGSSEDVAWIREHLHLLIEDYHVTAGFTCLADGADQLYAELLASQAIPYTPVLPCRRYQEAFQDEGVRERFKRFLSAAPKIVWLDFDRPSRAAFFEAGKTVVDRSDMMFAVWDGNAARGLGGTADVVAYALRRRKPVIYLNPVTHQIERPNQEQPLMSIRVCVETYHGHGGE